MLGQRVRYDAVPFFWTAQYGRSLRYAGHALRTDEVVVHGSTNGGLAAEFTAYYTLGDAVVAVATYNRDPQAAAAAELLRRGMLPSAAAVAAVDALDLVTLLRKRTVEEAEGAGRA